MRDGGIILLEPPASNRATGGYRFNDALIRVLREVRRLRLTPAGVARAARTGRSPIRSVQNGYRAAASSLGGVREPAVPSTVLVDSLYLRHPAAMGALRRLRRVGTTCVLLAHLLPSQERPARYSRAAGRRREHATLRSFDGAVAPSRFMQSALAERGVPEARIAVVEPPDGTGGARRGSVAGAPGAAAASTTPRRLVSVANLHPVKNLHAVIPALPRTDSGADAWTWEILGSRMTAPRYFHRIRRIAAMYGVAHRLRFRGVKTPEEVEAAIAHATALLIPSRFESFGMVARTAAQLGTPIIASEVGGIPEAVGTAATSEAVASERLERAAGQSDPYTSGSVVLLSPTDTAGWCRAIGEILARPNTLPPGDRAAGEVSAINAGTARSDFTAVAALLETLEREVSP